MGAGCPVLSTPTLTACLEKGSCWAKSKSVSLWVSPRATAAGLLGGQSLHWKNHPYWKGFYGWILGKRDKMGLPAPRMATPHHPPCPRQAGQQGILTSRMVHRSDWHSTSSQGWNMPRVTQFRRMTSMLTCSNQVRGGR